MIHQDWCINALSWQYCPKLWSNMASDVELISSAVLWDYVTLPDILETFYFTSSPIQRKHKLTDQANGLAKKCCHNGKWCSVKILSLRVSIDFWTVSAVAPSCWNQTVARLVKCVTLGIRTNSPYEHIGCSYSNCSAIFNIKRIRTKNTKC